MADTDDKWVALYLKPGNVREVYGPWATIQEAEQYINQHKPAAGGEAFALKLSKPA